MKSPLAVLAVFYCFGIILAKFMPFDFWTAAAAAAVIFLLLVSGRARNYQFTGLLLLLALLFGYLNLKNSCFLSKCHISNFIHCQDNSLYRLTGSIQSELEFKGSRFEFIFRVEGAAAGKLRWDCRGKVLVQADAFAWPEEKPFSAQKLSYGDNLALLGKPARPHDFDSASRRYKEYLASRDIYLIMRVKDSRQIIRQGGFGGSRLIAASFWLRAKMEGIINRHLANLPAGVLSAMILGQRRNIPWLVNDSMIKSGTVHILVVSGFNVGIVAFIANLLLKILRIPRKVRVILVIACLLIYCVIAGLSNPVVRATAMGIVLLTAYLFKREPDIYNSLSAAGLFILIINPRQIFDIGFQLSFASVFAIAFLYPKFKCLARLESCRNKIWRFVAEGCLVSFSAWLGTLGIIALNFRIIAPVTILANILIVPLAGVITLCGFTLVLSGLVCPALASFCGFPISILVNLLLTVNSILIKLPFAYIYF